MWCKFSRCHKNTERDNTKSFFFMTTLHHIRQNRFATRRKHSAREFYPTRLILQTQLLPITTRLRRYVARLLSSALVRTKMWKNGSTNGSQQNGKIFTGAVFTNCPKDGKNVQQAMEHFSGFNVFLATFRIPYLYTWYITRLNLFRTFPVASRYQTPVRLQMRSAKPRRN